MVSSYEDDKGKREYKIFKIILYYLENIYLYF